MNNLFSGFDLGGPVSIEPIKPVAKKGTSSAPKKVAEQSLFTDSLAEFNIDLNKPKVSTLLSRMPKNEDISEMDAEKVLKSKKLSLEERLGVIKLKVLEVLGRQKKNVVVIKTREEFSNYVSEAIKFGRIAIDTETNNSLDPYTCKLMGLCLYYLGGKQTYIPINHVDYKTGGRLDWQLTEEDCREELQRIKDAGTFIVMHNGKFDYEVLKCTCSIEIPPHWDTMIGARLINENEKANLKLQYISKIDPEQEKYDIEKLFENIAYAFVDPEIFALYAATDSMMTDKLFLYQWPIMTAPENERLYWVFLNIEMPIVKVTGDMELLGVCVDQEFGNKLRLKFNQLLEGVDARITEELETLRPKIEKWKTTNDATDRTIQYPPKKTKLTEEKIEARYPYIDAKTGKRYKLGKAKIEQLEDPINLASPTQLAILFYDVLGCKAVSKKSPRGTGEEELKAIAEKYGYKICDLILERRGYVKLITTYIDTIPVLIDHWPDKRIRFHLNSMGTDTGRYSSGGKLKFMEDGEAVEVSGINIQNIPSRGDGKIARLLFKAKEENNNLEVQSNPLGQNFYELPEISEIETAEGWKYGKDLIIGDRLITDEGIDLIVNIVYINKTYIIYTQEEVSGEQVS